MQGTPFDTRLGEPFTVQVDSCWRIQRMRWPFWLYYGILVAQSESDVAFHEEANDAKRPPAPHTNAQVAAITATATLASQADLNATDAL